MTLSNISPRREWPSKLSVSPTLDINGRVALLRGLGQSIINLGFGEVGLPVMPELQARLGESASANAYAPVAGSEAARLAAASWFRRRSLPTEADQIVFGPGSKSLLWALMAALPGDLVLPQPSWVTYRAQGALTGKRILQVPVPSGVGGIPEPEALANAVKEARNAGTDPGILVLTLPDNPTGTLPPADLVERVCSVAEQLDLVIISDEIYRDLAYESDNFRSPASFTSEQVIVTGGLSKALALGGWRIGFARLPSNLFGETLLPRLLGIASETWSALATPMLHIAAWALDDPEPVREYVARSRHLHAKVTLALHGTLAAAGVPCPRPQAAFYLYPDFRPLQEGLYRQGITDAPTLARHLLDRHHIATLPGVAFGEDARNLRLRLATALLYGDSEDQRRASLATDDPANLPWVRSSIERISAAMLSLSGAHG